MATTAHVRSSLHMRIRRGTACLGVAALASVGLVAAGVPAYAVHDEQMQLDGNTADDSGATPAYDWESFFQAGSAGTGGDISNKGSLPTDFVARGHIADYALPDASTFATGSKDTLNIGAIAASAGHKATAAGWQCGSSNNVSSKDDLVNVYTVAYRDPSTHHLLLYFGAEKSSNLGDNNIGIWFLQDSIACASGNGNTNFTGHHKPGDVLLTASFSNGGTVATVESHVWEAGTENGGEGHLGSDNTGAFLCGDTDPAHAETAAGAYACAITNTNAIDPPWNHPVKTPAAGTTDSLAAQEFYEGGIDVTQAAANAHVTEPCITNFLADTRSSTSPTATLFDYGASGFPVCTPTTTLLNTPATASATQVHAGESVTFTWYEKNDGDVALTSPHLSSSNSGCNASLASVKNATDISGTTIDETQFNVGDADFDGVLDPGEEWTFTCSTSFVAGTANPHVTVFGHGTDIYTGNDVTYYTTGTTTPVACTAGAVDSSGRFCDLQETATVSVSLVNPGTTLREAVSAVVTFTYFEKNTGDVDITGSSVNVSSDCAGAGATATASNQADDPGTLGVDESTLNVGDANDDGLLNPGETWQFTCQKTVSASSTTASATFSDTGTGHGTDALGTAVPSTNESDSSSVTVTNDSPNTAP